MNNNSNIAKGWAGIIKNRSKSQILLLGVALAVIIIIMCFATDRFYQTKNIMNVLTQITALGISAAGAAIVLISGGIDLTLGNIISFAGCVTAAMMGAGINTGTAVFVGILVAIGCGALNGTLIVLSKAEPFIITLGMMSVYNGLTLLVTGGMNLPTSSDFTFGRERLGGVVPIPVLCLVAVFLAVFFILKFTKFGRRIYAIGDNTEAAYLSGIKIKRNKVYVYALNGGLLGIASMILLSRLSSGNSVMGDSLLMEAIAAAVIGGVSMAGGRGSIWGVFLGTVLIGVISNALNLLSVASFYQYIVLGAIIVGAVFVSNIGSKNR
ncbi:ABC transporter permease [Christensenellaceae bacterium OttesenSCG-928-K19]|nr:ABC transporter permease [Christensenellaceae bacterium OttesenSCG-928-K19]